MNVTLKNFKTAKSVADDSINFSATVYIDGKKWGEAMDDGWGGGMQMSVFDVKNQEYLQANYGALEIRINKEVTNVLIKKDFKKAMRKISLYNAKTNEMVNYPARFKPTPENQRIAAEKNPGFVVMNSMNEDEALKYFKTYQGVK